MRIIWRACLSALSLNGTPLDRLPSHYPTLPGITASPRTLRATPLVVLDRGRRPCETARRATRRLTCHELAINDLMLTQNHLENRCAPLDDTMNKKRQRRLSAFAQRGQLSESSDQQYFQFRP